MSAIDPSHPLWDPELDRQSPRIVASTWTETVEGPDSLDEYTRPTTRSPNDLSLNDPGSSRNSTPFAIALGIVGPLICLAVDPGVFKGGFNDDGRDPILGEYQFFSYSFIGLEIIALTAWLVVRQRLGRCCGAVAGILMVGSAFATSVGVCLLPWSFLGLLVAIGVLGLTPFVTAYVYFRHGRLALESARTRSGLWTVAFWFLIGGTLAVALPALGHIRVNRAWQAALRDMVDSDPSPIGRFEFWSGFVDPSRDPADLLEEPIALEHDPVRKQRLIDLQFYLRSVDRKRNQGLIRPRGTPAE